MLLIVYLTKSLFCDDQQGIVFDQRRNIIHVSPWFHRQDLNIDPDENAFVLAVLPESKS